jgi:hypothetical protein
MITYSGLIQVLNISRIICRHRNFYCTRTAPAVCFLPTVVVRFPPPAKRLYRGVAESQDVARLTVGIGHICTGLIHGRFLSVQVSTQYH